MWCKNRLVGETRNGTTHLNDHLKLCQTSACRKVSVEKYIFDQEVVRKELALMICLHVYPLSLVDHTAFRKFCAAMQPLFKVPPRNTVRIDIMDMHIVKRKSLVKYFQ
ncbi:hypothetical protein HU200_063633 [Digitaria exilis]|uniref:Uncharacterized protein n=1 Tax=Digitaria exilis TaxID=1010633 RepID=A0A835ADA5_9POAL|nr:hypothetical protein HU200_063633 [Digitaria exilis]